MIYINYDKNTFRVLSAYGEEENTPLPFIVVSVEDWYKVSMCGMNNPVIYVNDDYKTLRVDLATYKTAKIEGLSKRCEIERRLLLDDTKILNILSGATYGYPDYLTPANVAKFIEVYKTIYHTYAAQINVSETKEEIDTIISGISYPDEQYFIDILRT